MAAIDKLIISLEGNPEALLAIRALLNARRPSRKPSSNRTYPHMRVRPSAYGTFSSNIWERSKMFKPSGRSATAGNNEIIPTAKAPPSLETIILASRYSELGRRLKRISPVASKAAFDKARELYGDDK